MTKLGIGILSHAHGHANTYCQAMQDFDDVELVATWDDNVERGQQAAGRRCVLIVTGKGIWRGNEGGGGIGAYIAFLRGERDDSAPDLTGASRLLDTRLRLLTPLLHRLRGIAGAGLKLGDHCLDQPARRRGDPQDQRVCHQHQRHGFRAPGCPKTRCRTGPANRHNCIAAGPAAGPTEGKGCPFPARAEDPSHGPARLQPLPGMAGPPPKQPRPLPG